MLWEIRNHSGARDIFLDGQKYYFPRQGTLRTRNPMLKKLVSDMPGFSVVEAVKRKKYPLFTAEHKKNMHLGQIKRYKREEAKKRESELIIEAI